MSNENMTVIEINGVKMEVDLRHAKRIDNFRVGSKVKLLLSESNYGSTTKNTRIYPGVVVGFEPFDSLPTIVIAYLEIDYATATVKFAYVNSETAGKWQVIASIDDTLPIQKSDVLSRIDREIAKKSEEIDDMQRKRDYFVRHFDSYFETALPA